jgi:hypothetical protein
MADDNYSTRWLVLRYLRSCLLSMPGESFVQYSWFSSCVSRCLRGGGAAIPPPFGIMRVGTSDNSQRHWQSNPSNNCQHDVPKKIWCILGGFGKRGYTMQRGETRQIKKIFFRPGHKTRSFFFGSDVPGNTTDAKWPSNPSPTHIQTTKNFDDVNFWSFGCQFETENGNIRVKMRWERRNTPENRKFENGECAPEPWEPCWEQE